MRGTKAKAMRKYVRKQFPFLSASPLYTLGEYGSQTAVLTPQCQRHAYQKIKRAYKIARRTNSNKWRRYNANTSNA
jgi:hypothetical protein